MAMGFCRTYGCDAPVGRIYSINPAMIILLVPVVGALLANFEHFDVIHWGGYISGLAPFWIVFFRPGEHSLCPECSQADR